MKRIDPFLLTCLDNRETHLPVDLWMESKGIGYLGRKHNPYKLLVKNQYDGKRYYLKKCFWVSIDPINPKLLTRRRLRISEYDLDKIFEYIKLHYEDFDNHIKYDESDVELHFRLFKDKIKRILED